MRFLCSLVCGASALLLSACGPGAPNALCAEMESVVAEANAAVQEREGAFRAALTAAATAGPSSAGTCPVGKPAFEQGKVFSAGDVATALPISLLELAGADAEVGLFRDTCGTGDIVSQQALIVKYREAIAALPTKQDLVVIERERVAPNMQSNTTFSPGSLRVTGLLYSYAEKRVVCLAEASVSNRETVLANRGARDTDFLQMDLNRNAIEAVRGSLQAVSGP